MDCSMPGSSVLHHLPELPKFMSTEWVMLSISSMHIWHLIDIVLLLFQWMEAKVLDSIYELHSVRSESREKTPDTVMVNKTE